MHRPLFCLCLLAALLAPGLAVPSAMSQHVHPPQDSPSQSWADSPPTATQEMIYLYLQELRRYEEPQQVVRRNAQFRAAQRRYRIAAMKWMGYCRLRPTLSPTPYMGTYAPVTVAYWQPPPQPPSFPFPFSWDDGR